MRMCEGIRDTLNSSIMPKSNKGQQGPQIKVVSKVFEAFEAWDPRRMYKR